MSNRLDWPQRALAGCTLSLLASAIPLSAGAQADAPPPSSPSADATAPQALQAVTIEGRAQRRLLPGHAGLGPLGERPLIDTPFAITAVDHVLIERLGARKLQELARSDASLAVTGPAGTSGNGGLFARGFAISFYNMLYDGLSTPINGFGYPLDAVERVEILKGASAFLVGAGPSGGIGGAVNVVPKAPPASGRIASARVFFSDKNVLGLHADLGGRFGADEVFGWRVNAMSERGETRIGTQHKDFKSLNLVSDWRVSRELKLSLGLDRVLSNVTRYQNGFLLASGLPVPAAPDPTVNLMQQWNYQDQNVGSAYLRGELGLNEQWTLSGQFMQGKVWRPYVSPGTVNIVNADGGLRINGSSFRADQEFSAAQAQLRGQLRTGALRHELSLGWSDSRDETQTEQATLAALLSNLHRPVYHPLPPLNFGPKGRWADNRAQGLVLSDFITLTEDWSLLLGARRAAMRVRNYNNASGAITRDYDKRVTTPLAALVYKLGRRTSLYANYGQGLELGGRAPAGLDNAGEDMPPIESSQIELGAKLELAQGASLSAALFEIEKGLEYTDTTRSPKGVYVQDGKQLHRGLELSASGELGPDIKLMGSVMLLNPSVRNNGNPAQAGKQPMGVPRRNLSLWAEYALSQGWFVHGGVYAKSAQFVNGTNTLRLPSWVRYDLGVRHESRLLGGPTALSLAVENLADRHFWASSAGGTLALAAGRTVKASAKLDF